jgi:hypothetical protein
MNKLNHQGMYHMTYMESNILPNRDLMAVQVFSAIEFEQTNIRKALF